MNNHINILFQGCTVARSSMKRITSHNRHNRHISNHLWPQPGNLEPSCAVDFCGGSRRGTLDWASVVEMEGEGSGGAPAKKKLYLCTFNNSWTEEFNFLSRSPHLFKVCRTDFNIGHGGKNNISLLNHSSTYYKHTMLMLYTMLQCCNVICSTGFSV